MEMREFRLIASDIATHQLVPGRQYSPLVSKYTADLRAMYEDVGMSQRDIGRMIGLSGFSAGRKLGRLGVTALDRIEMGKKHKRLASQARTIKAKEILGGEPSETLSQLGRVGTVTQVSEITGIPVKTIRMVAPEVDFSRSMLPNVPEIVMESPQFHILSDRQKGILTDLQGWSGHRRLTLEEVGEKQGVSKEAIHAIHGKIKSKLQRFKHITFVKVG